MHGQECINCVSLTAGLDTMYTRGLLMIIVMHVEYVSDSETLCLFSGCFSYLFSLIYIYVIDSPTFILKSPLLCIFFADKAKKAIITLIIHVTLLLLLTGNYLSENIYKSMFNSGACEYDCIPKHYCEVPFPGVLQYLAIGSDARDSYKA